MSAVKNKKFTPTYTYDDYKSWEGDWELISGVPFAMAPSPMFNHQTISMLISNSLQNSIIDCEKCVVVSEMDYKLSNDTIFRPDITMVCGQKDGAYINKTPEIIFEIVSPSSASKDENIKYLFYETEKVPYYVIVYPEDLKAKVYKLDKDGKYQKDAELFDTEYEFTNLSCLAKVDFDFVFKRFRN